MTPEAVGPCVSRPVRRGHENELAGWMLGCRVTLGRRRACRPGRGSCPEGANARLLRGRAHHAPAAALPAAEPLPGGALPLWGGQQRGQPLDAPGAVRVSGSACPTRPCFPAADRPGPASHHLPGLTCRCGSPPPPNPPTMPLQSPCTAGWPAAPSLALTPTAVAPTFPLCPLQGGQQRPAVAGVHSWADGVPPAQPAAQLHARPAVALGRRWEAGPGRAAAAGGR